MKIVFMGTPVYALACLKGLYEGGHEVLAVLTQPDKPQGRKQELVPSPVKAFAIEKGLAIYQPKRAKSKDCYAYLQGLATDVYVVAAYGQILPQRLLDIAPLGAVNVHASLLPKYRGASPIQQAILNGDSETGITIMQMDEGIDTGDILMTQAVAIDDDDTGGSLHDKLVKVAPPLLLRALAAIEDGSIRPMKQDDALSSYAPILKRDMGKIDWNRPALDILNLIRGFNPYPGAYMELAGRRVKVWQAVATAIQADGAAVGEVVKPCPKEGLFIKAADGVVHIISLQQEGKRRMTAAEFVRGGGWL